MKRTTRGDQTQIPTYSINLKSLGYSRKEIEGPYFTTSGLSQELLTQNVSHTGRKTGTISWKNGDSTEKNHQTSGTIICTFHWTN